jgi:hypothetical protein
MNMSAGTIRLNLPRASVNPGFRDRSGASARPADRQSVEVVESTSSAVARPASRLARWLPLVLRPLLGAFLLAASLFVVQASGAVPGFAPQSALACSEVNSGFTTSDLWLGTGYSNNTPPNTQQSSNTRTVWWDANVTGAWCYGYHFASYDGGATWFRSTATSGWGRVMRDNITVGSDGYANSLIGNSLRYRSCSAQAGLYAHNDQVWQWNGTCTVTPAAGAMNNNLVIDTQYPTPGFHISDVAGGGGTQTCFAPGQMYSIVDGGSWDPSPSSGWAGSVGMWHYHNAWTQPSGWTNNSHWEYNAYGGPLGSQIQSEGEMHIRDNSLLETYGVRYFNVDNTYPNGAWISGLPTYTNQTTFNLSMNANASGCQPLDKVVIRNDSGDWLWYGMINSASNWNILSSGGGNSNQGTHTVYAMFSQRGVYNWTGVQISTFYDTQAPSTSATSPTYSSSRTVPLSFTDSDPGPSSGTYSGGWVNAYWSTGSGWNGCNTIYNPPDWTGTINCTVPGDGLYSFATKVQDSAGNQSTLPNTAMTQTFVDTQSPSTSISTSTPCIAPGGTATYTVGRTDPDPTSGWLANGSTSWLNGVEGPWDGTRIDPWGGGTGAGATFNAGGFPTPASGTQGVYTRVVWTRDNAQNSADGVWNQGRYAGIGVTVDNTTPSNPTISSSLPVYTNTSVITLGTVSATAGGCKGIDNVAISNNGSNWYYSGTPTASGAWDLAAYGGNLNQGTHTIWFAVHEAGSAAADPWARFQRTIIYDSVAPTQSGYTFSGGSNWFARGTTVYINTNVNGSVLVTALVTDAGSGVKNVRFSNPSGQAGWTYPQGVDPSYPYDDLISWNAGASNWAGTPSSQAEDNAGNVSAWSSGWTFAVDGTPPVIAWTNPTADVYDTTGTVTPAWTVTDAGSGVSGAGTVARYYLPTLSANVCSGEPVYDGVQTSGTPTTVTSGRCYYWTFMTPPSDILGNVTATNLTSKTIKVDTVHPTGDLTFDDTSGVTHSRFINASVTMADANSGPLQVRFSTDGGFSWTAWTAYVVGTPTVTPLTLASGTGTYTVLAQIQDLAGNMTPLGHSTALLNSVIEPTLGAAAKIYDCANPSTLLATNTTGTIYWSVDRTLCLVPTARLVAPGSDGTSSPTLVGTIAAPSGTPGNYILRNYDQTWTLVGGTWPPYVGVTRTAADTPLRFTFGRETSSLSTSTPYLTIPYDTQAVVGWYNGATLVRSETVTVTLNLRVVVKNSGTTGTQ